jgi:hypothetical protein
VRGQIKQQLSQRLYPRDWGEIIDFNKAIR